jgi:Flp pilus assembly protein TadB
MELHFRLKKLISFGLVWIFLVLCLILVMPATILLISALILLYIRTRNGREIARKENHKKKPKLPAALEYLFPGPKTA